MARLEHVREGLSHTAPSDLVAAPDRQSIIEEYQGVAKLGEALAIHSLLVQKRICKDLEGQDGWHRSPVDASRRHQLDQQGAWHARE